jgi:hypothetical protein
MGRSLARWAVAGSAAALCTSLALPAFAGTTTGTSSARTSKSDAGPLAGVTDVTKARAAVDAMIAAQMAQMTRQLAALNANTTVNATLKAAGVSRISTRVTALQALQTQIAAETSVTAMRADLNAFWLAQLKSWVDFRIDTRVAELSSRLTATIARTGISAQPEATLAARIQSRITALAAVRASVDAATTLSQARSAWAAARPFFGDRDLMGGADHNVGTSRSRALVGAKVSVRTGRASQQAATWHPERPHHPRVARIGG